MSNLLLSQEAEFRIQKEGSLSMRYIYIYIYIYIKTTKSFQNLMCQTKMQKTKNTFF